MNVEIPREVLSATTLCSKGFACLTRPVETVGKLSSDVRGDILFVDCDRTVNCDYRVRFGYGQFCTCPTRRAIYERHGI
jgi:hypothetical protein